MWAKAGLLEDWWLRNCWAHSVWIWLWLKNFFLQMTFIQTWCTYTPRSHTTSLSSMPEVNMRLMNSKLDVWQPSWGSKPSNLCLSQNQASLTLTHSQNKWTLSWITLQIEQFGEAIMLNLKTLSLFAMMLWTIRKRISLPMTSKTGFCSLVHTCAQSTLNLNTTLK